MKKKGQQPKKPRRGRPWKNTPGSRPRTFRVTDAEYELLMAHLEVIRRRSREDWE